MKDTDIVIKIIALIIVILFFCGSIAAVELVIYFTIKKIRNLIKKIRNRNSSTTNIPYETYIGTTINTQTQLTTDIPAQNITYRYYPYIQRPLLTQTEYTFYMALKQQCDRNGLLICPKVRMEDFINVTAQQDKLKYRGYIKSRHIDFMICDKWLNLIAGLELDDRSHQRPDVAQTDRFKDEVFRTIGLPLYRIRTSNEAYDTQIEQIIRHMMTIRNLPTQRQPQ